MKRIGIIGVGEIGRAVVVGLCDGVDESPEVFLSPRGAHTSAELSSRYEGVQVCADNQEVADRSEVVIIAGPSPCPPYANAAPSRSRRPGQL